MSKCARLYKPFVLVRASSFSRCLQCNTLLRAIANSLWRKGSPYVYATQMTFKHCVICDRL